MTKTRDEIQKEAVQALLWSGGKGTCHITTGVGKSKILLGYLDQLEQNCTVLITVPLTTLITNWKDEIIKWWGNPSSIKEDENILTLNRGEYTFQIHIQTIQTAYKWEGLYFTVLCVDEVHTQVTEEYGKIFDNIKYTHVIGLTATTDTLRRPDKHALYEQYCPVVYEYLEAEEDGVVNKIDYTIVEHELNDLFKVPVGSKKRPFLQGEKSAYDYWQRQITEVENTIIEMGALIHPAAMAIAWADSPTATLEQKAIAQKYKRFIWKRKELLLSLQSTSTIAKTIARRILMENDTNKLLVFSELVAQAKSICVNVVHGKQKEEVNAQLITRLNEGKIRSLGSCYSLTLGKNLDGVTHAIVESYQGSDTKFNQRVGRLHRLPIDQTANIYIIKVKGTQSEVWFDSMSTDLNLTNAKIVQSSEILKLK